MSSLNHIVYIYSLHHIIITNNDDISFVSDRNHGINIVRINITLVLVIIYYMVSRQLRTNDRRR